jgi:PAS domain S-box-containing protein
MSSQVIDTLDGTILRTVVPFKNKPECHACHDPARKLNGIVIFDMDAGAIKAAATRDLRWMVGVSAILTLLLTGLIAVIVRVAVLRRLQRFETTAREIAGGQFDRRVPASGSDTISWLAREFNAMADSVTGLLTQVRDERERLETVINSIDDGIVVLDPQRNVIAANAAFLRRTGHSRDDVLGCSCTSSAPGMCTVADCPSLACLRTGQRQVRIVERRTPDGGVRWEEVHASPIRSRDGGPAHVVEVWRDISDRRAAEARLAESHRLASLGMLASGFSHELNTPLATVLTCVEGMARDLPPVDGDPALSRIAEHAAIAREQILRCRGITQHFLRMSRGQTSAIDVVDVAGSLAAVARLVAPTAREHHVQIRVEPIAASLRVRADDAGLQHALINLALNAIQACQAGGTVTIGAEAGETVRIRVSDTGCGIPAEHRTRIFEPFFSLRKGGTGLGLFLSLNFIQRCGGDIHVDSPPGQGTTFEITLPAASQEAAAQASA